MSDLQIYDSGDLGIDEDTADWLPTPAQIKAACAKIRSKWSKSERRRRRVGPGRQRWHAPTVSTLRFGIVEVGTDAA
jgi:hypothetical protein